MEDTKHYDKWTIKEFRALPRPSSYWNVTGEVDSLIILPTKRKHDSGYRCMEFVAIQNRKPTYILSGCSDVLRLGGMGGYNVYRNSVCNYARRVESGTVPVIDWKIDCLPVSGLLRIHCSKRMIVGASVSDFEVFFKEY